MCLGVPGRVLEVDGLCATVDFWGVKRQVQLHICDEDVVPGDYVLNHVGYAIRKIPASEVEATMALYEELLRASEASADDLMTADVRGEMRAAQEPSVDSDE